MSVTESVGLISEHESRASEATPAGYQPTPAEEKAIKTVDMLYSRAKNGRKPYDEKWVDFYRMFRGKQWKEQRPQYRHSEVINLIFRAIQSQVPLLSDALPKPEFIPQNPNDYELSRILNDVLDSDWNYNNWSAKFTESLFDSHIYGTGLGCMKYDPKADNDVGGIKYESSDPFYQYPDPKARDVNTRARYYVEAEPVDIEVLKKDYPDKAPYLKPDLVDMMKRDKALSEQVKYVSPNNDRMIMEGSSPLDLGSSQEALKITAYIKDEESVEEELSEIDPVTKAETKKYVTRLKYPNGRKIVTVSRVLCEDGPMEYEDGKFPYLRLPNYIDPRNFWGISEIEQLESPQKIFNKLVSFALDVLTLMGNPIWKVPSTAGIDTDNLFNRPGLILEYDGDQAPTREEGVQLQPYVITLIDKIKLSFDDISGDNDVSRGVKPEGVTAASAIEALQEAQRTRQRQKARNIDAFMQDFGQMYLSRVFQYYTAPKIFRITDNQNVTKYFKFHVEKQVDAVTGDEKKVARIARFEEKVDPISGDTAGYAEAPEQQYEIRARFDVRINTGSSLPFEKSRVEQQSYALFDRGIIDTEEVLKNIRYPNAQAVMNRMAQKALEQQQAQMNAQGGAPAPQGAPLPPPAVPA